MDYKELINTLLYEGSLSATIPKLLEDAASSIEALLKEREAALKDLSGMCWCCVHGKKWDKAPESSKMITCEHMGEQFGGIARSGGKSKCPHWQWRGLTRPNPEQPEV